MDYEKLAVLYSDKRVQTRSKLVFCLLENGFLLEEIIHFPAENISMLKEIKNGESLFMEYIKGAGVIERVSQSGLLFPGTEGNPMQEESVLSFLRRSCRINGFQLHELEIDGLVSRPIATQSGIKKPVMSFDDVVSFIKNQNK